MNERIGQADARISLLRGKLAGGVLNPGIAAIMDGLDPAWREDPSIALWDTDYASYREWSLVHQRAPKPKDAGAAGLHGWLIAQENAAAAGTLTGDKIRALQHLHGWTGNISDPAAQSYYAIAARLRNAGFPAGSAHAKTRASEILSTWVDNGSQTSDQPELDTSSAHLKVFRGLFGYALFCAQNLRQPQHGEPGAKWLHDAQKNGTAEIPWIRELLATLGAASGPELSAGFRGRLDRYTAFSNQNHRAPRRRGASLEERACSSWFARQTARVRSGAATAAEVGALNALD